ncbi:patatin [Methylovirgula ligni]|uniref:NTE family protein n=1 Tax=Methylovirgula ligni TaxID=569860 RepID=A0A3D9YXN1_9HYPH|nr:patatin-like phospholipase family protein [Methylovirgula ligni]QAY95895.1 patatin [Methylovirgula ligni]REF86451.1 NTE family protein [Methylovirgula ligni]
MTNLKRVNLALQGGGSHGAFTWGVLDYLLEDGRLDIAAVSGTSAGAMNAVVLAQGWMENGRDGAREALQRFWRAISTENALSPAQAKFFDLFFGPKTLSGQFSSLWGDFFTHFASPYQFNPFDVNPLRDYLLDAIDFEKVRAFDGFKIFIAATNVHTGKIKVFKGAELTADHVMASATLPTLFQATVIDGEPYWDGGYMGNPALFPFFYGSNTPDIVIIQINPLERHSIPRSPREIQNRLDEITFNGALMGELRAIDFVVRLIDAGKLSVDDYVRPLVHRIDGCGLLGPYDAATKLDANWQLISSFFEYGRKAAKHWLDETHDHIGKQSTLNLRMAYS